LRPPQKQQLLFRIERMEFIKDFFWLFMQAVTFPKETMLISTGLFIIITTTCFYIHIIRRRSFNRIEPLTLVPFITMFLLLFWGTLLTHEDPYSEAPIWPPYVNLTIFACHIPICGFVIWKSKGFRLLAVEMSLLAGWYAFWSLFVSIMSVTGDWL
jgi:hypothetical protein